MNRPSTSVDYATNDNVIGGKSFSISSLRNKIIKWLLILWLICGIGLYVLNVSLFESTIQYLFKVPSWSIFLMAICNNVSLILAIVFEIRQLLIGSIILDCALLVAVPALIIDVGPFLLTYSSLMISIVLSIVYGVLYMRNPLFNDNLATQNYCLNINYQERSRLSYQCPAQPSMDQTLSATFEGNVRRADNPATLLLINGRIPRHSCQF